MFRFSSFRAKLQSSFVVLGLAAIAITDWQASSGAAEALREATYDRLTAVRETRARQLERYFEDLRKHVFALSTDESTLTALEEFRGAWDQLPGNESHSAPLREYYQKEFASDPSLIDRWFPPDARARTLQFHYSANNPHPPGSKDLLLTAPGAGRYSTVHARFHPTFHRYQSAFGFYDIFLIGGPDARVLYTVRKEADLGASLSAAPYRTTNLARAYSRAIQLEQAGDTAIEDYTAYVPSSRAPAAFVAAPIRRAGMQVGVLAIQVSIDEVNRVMNGDRGWREQGLGETGQAYAVGADNTLRSDVRFEIEHPTEYYAQLAKAGIGREIIERVQRSGTSVLTFPVNLAVSEQIGEGARGTEIGTDLRGVPVLRSHTPLKVQGLDWNIIAEIESSEALAPVSVLRTRVLTVGFTVASIFFLAAGFLAASVTRPVRALAESVRRLGKGDLGTQVEVSSDDELGELAGAFNRMSHDLAQTTVSKNELEVLAGRLIHAQEEERSRIARELHDDLTQRLAALAIEAGRLQKLTDTTQLQAGVERFKQQAVRLSEDVHGLSRRLHPALLEDLGLVAAIESECRGFLERGGSPVGFQADGTFDDVSPDRQLGLYRIVQESLRNIQRHSGADQITIRLIRGVTSIELMIEDNGGGFDRKQSTWRAGVGIASMEERTRLLGGRFYIESKPGVGTRIEVALPEHV